MTENNKFENRLLVVSGSRDKTVRVWDVSTGQCEATWEGHSGPVYSVCFIMIVGEGRAGKTALARSIIGQPYTETDSTLGIDDFTCSVSNICKGNAEWSKVDNTEKEYETGLAFVILKKNAGESDDATGDIAEAIEAKRSVHAGREIDFDSIETSGGTSILQSSPKRPSEAKPSHSTPRKVTSQTASVSVSDSISADTTSSSEAHPRMGADDIDDTSKVQGVEAEPDIVDEEYLMKCLSDTAFTASNLRIAVFNYGGQPVFDVIHHLFLTEYGVYTLCFNCNWLLPAAISESRDQCLRFLQKWLNSIVLHTYDAETKVTAPVALIGTHTDEVSSTADHHQISELLNDYFQSNPAWKCKMNNRDGVGCDGARTNLCFFPVDNVKGRANDPVFKDLMVKIEETIDQAKYTHKLVPLTWLRCLDSLKDTKKSCLSYSRVVDIAATCGVERHEVSSFLLLLHDMGTILWINEVGLRDVVILDAIDYLVKPATLVVCNLTGKKDDKTRHYEKAHEKAHQQHEDEWLSLINKGLLKRPLLETLWENRRDDIDTIVALMCRYGLLVPIITPRDNDHVSTNRQVHDFVVPALLPAAPSGMICGAEWGNRNEKDVLTCYMVFSMSASFVSTTAISQNVLRTKGFLPNGLFERLLGKCIAWSQKVSVTGCLRLGSMALYKDMALLHFGSQTFRITPLYHLHCIRIDIEGSNPLPVMQRIHEFVLDIIQQCMKSLHAFVAVPVIGATDAQYESAYCLHNKLRADLTKAAFETELETQEQSMHLLPLDNIRESVKNEEPLLNEGTCLVSLHDILRDFDCWLNLSNKAREWYDIFLSYCWGAFDSDIVTQVFDAMTNYAVGTENRRIHVFLDKRRLQKGKEFDREFAKALVNSSVVIPIVSEDALYRMSHEFNPASCDNVLLEWMTTLELMHSQSGKSKVQLACPIMIGHIEQTADMYDGIIEDLFKSENYLNLPSVVPSKTIEVAKALLRDNDITPSGEFDNYTVKSFVEAFLKLNGEIIKSSAGAQAILAGPSLAMLPSYVSKQAHTLLKRCAIRKEKEDTILLTNNKDIAVENASRSQKAATSPKDAAGNSSTKPLQKIWALLHHPRKCHDLIGLTEYLEEDLCIDMADELADYMKMDHVIGKLRGFLKSGPQRVFDENIKEWKEMRK